MSLVALLIVPVDVLTEYPIGSILALVALVTARFFRLDRLSWAQVLICCVSVATCGYLTVVQVYDRIEQARIEDAHRAYVAKYNKCPAGLRELVPEFLPSLPIFGALTLRREPFDYYIQNGFGTLVVPGRALRGSDGFHTVRLQMCFGSRGEYLFARSHAPEAAHNSRSLQAPATNSRYH